MSASDQNPQTATGESQKPSGKKSGSRRGLQIIGGVAAAGLLLAAGAVVGPKILGQNKAAADSKESMTPQTSTTASVTASLLASSKAIETSITSASISRVTTSDASTPAVRSLSPEQTAIISWKPETCRTTDPIAGLQCRWRNVTGIYNNSGNFVFTLPTNKDVQGLFSIVYSDEYVQTAIGYAEIQEYMKDAEAWSSRNFIAETDVPNGIVYTPSDITSTIAGTDRQGNTVYKMSYDITASAFQPGETSRSILPDRSGRFKDQYFMFVDTLAPGVAEGTYFVQTVAPTN